MMRRSGGGVGAPMPGATTAGSSNTGGGADQQSMASAPLLRGSSAFSVAGHNAGGSAGTTTVEGDRSVRFASDTKAGAHTEAEVQTTCDAGHLQACTFTHQPCVVMPRPPTLPQTRWTRRHSQCHLCGSKMGHRSTVWRCHGPETIGCFEQWYGSQTARTGRGLSFVALCTLTCVFPLSSHNPWYCFI